MTANDRFDSELEGWLRAEAATPAPADLHGAAIDRARRSRQRPGWLVAVRGTVFGRSSGAIDVQQHRLAYAVVAVALLLGLLGAAILAGAFRVAPTRLSLNGAIAYSVEAGSDGVWLVDADGSHDREIATGSCPTFVRSGSALAFTTNGVDLTIDEITNGSVSSSRVLAGIGLGEYALSPDGKRVAWFQGSVPDALNPADAELWVRDVAGGPATRILPASGIDRELDLAPAWSPDGRQIAFARALRLQGGNNSGVIDEWLVSVVDADGSDPHDLAHPQGSRPEFSWSPDGRWIAYLGLPDGVPFPINGGATPPEDVFVVAADGSTRRPLTKTDADEAQPVWSPDGSHLAYITIGQQSVLTTVRMAGSQAAAAPVLGGPAPDGTHTDEVDEHRYAFAWSPDGTRLAFVTRDPTPDPELVNGTIATIFTIDAELRTVPVTVAQTRAIATLCGPTWQRLEP